MAILNVGPGQTYSTINDAVIAASAGDTIDVQAGTYTNDFLTIEKTLTLQGIGGQVILEATINAPNGKGIITEGHDGMSLTINNFDISGAVVSDNNGAAIRYEGGNLTLNDDDIHNNQEGMLAFPDIINNGQTITINHSEFSHNGDGSGFTHGIYVGDVTNLNINNSYFHDVNEGHEIKSRAENTTITNSRIFDNSSTASYSIDLPNGGNAIIQNNQIEQGANTHNPNIIAYGEEGSLHAGTNVLIDSNLFVNDDLSSSSRLLFNGTAIAPTFSNNQIYGLTAAQLGGPLNTSNTVFLASRPPLDTSSLTFINTPPPPPPPTHGHNGGGHGHGHNNTTATINTATNTNNLWLNTAMTADDFINNKPTMHPIDQPTEASASSMATTSAADIAALFAAMLHN